MMGLGVQTRGPRWGLFEMGTGKRALTTCLWPRGTGRPVSLLHWVGGSGWVGGS